MKCIFARGDSILKFLLSCAERTQKFHVHTQGQILFRMPLRPGNIYECTALLIVENQALKNFGIHLSSVSILRTPFTFCGILRKSSLGGMLKNYDVFYTLK